MRRVRFKAGGGPKRDPVDYAADADDDEDEESFEDDDDKEEEHLAPDYTAVSFPAIDLVSSAEETYSFETDKFAATPPPPPHAYRTTARIAAGIRLRATSPLPLSASFTSRKADIPEADIPPRKRLLLTTPTHGFEVGGVLLLLLLDSQDLLWTMGSITALDHAALRGEVDTLRRYLSSLCTTHEHERVEARQALARFEAHNRALEARIAVLETQAHRHKWQRQDADDRATRHIIHQEIGDIDIESEEPDVVEKYMGGLPNMIKGNVMSTKPKTIEEAVEMVNNLMDQKLHTLAERQIENKRKQDENFRNNKNQQ
uniref:Reverse transcriptase domain-containing protein n=1 Tax=Tanacetum cinerariifolium TaxID=118510 RepID=A0A699KEP0_TANCI|nr:reverse transcriptase domain-containing protein [Tanacetum cinerariifolium]